MATLGKHNVKILATALARRYASVAKLVDISVNDRTGIAMVCMNRPPVNSLSLELITELTSSFRELERNKCRGIILTSALPKIFCGGLEVLELYKPNMERVEIYWRSYQELWLTLYGTGLPTAAAINGACPVAGCILAMSCEHRVFVGGKHTIGLSEMKLGLIVPEWIQDTLINIIGHRRAEISLLQGCLYTPEDALRIGLVDELATDQGDAIAKCENYVLLFAKISPEARSISKLQLHQAPITWLKENRDVDTETFLTRIVQPRVQKVFHDFIHSSEKK